MKANAPLIGLRNVRMEFSVATGRVVALSDIELDVAAHEFVTLLGPSGCGKSTLLLLIAGLLRPSGGTIHVENAPVTGPVVDAAIVFQRDNLLEWRTIIDNVLLPVEIRRLDYRRHVGVAEALLARVGLTGFEKAYPHQLSGGMRQRVALCRALVCDLPLLLMDEPFGALDALSREEHQLLLQNVWLDQRKTVVFVTHDIREAVLLSDRVVVMTPRPGRIAEIVPIDLPRPRHQALTESAAFNELVSMLRRHMIEHGSLRVVGA